MKRFNDIAFVKHLEEWVSRVDDDDLNRAWEIVLGCMKVHARIDRLPKQSARAATREAWQDWALAFEGESGTYTMIGMLSELDAMCPEELRETEFMTTFEEAIALGRGEKLAAPQGAVSEPREVRPGGPVLRVIRGWRE